MADARMPSGVSVADAVDFGALRGVSIGYSYASRDCSYDEATGTLTVNKWRLLEVSLTPTPADTTGQVRSLPTLPTTGKDNPMTLPASPAVREDCTTCPASDQTLKAGIERIMKDRIDGVTEVVQVV
jgi:hypothetical protein